MNARILSLTTMVALAVSAEAGNITEKQAREIASRFLSSSQVATTRAVGEMSLDLARKSSGYYAFNRANGAGFVVVASSDNAAAQVLGYADKGSISPGDMPANMKAWLDEYDRQMAFAEAHPQLSSATTTSESRKAIAPLVTSTWNQNSPYSDLCPQVDGKNCPTGCTATAAAQVMYYHKWPKQGQGSISYSSSFDGYTTDVAVDFSKSTYDWDAMDESYNNESTQAANEAVALLMRDVGAAAKMQYSVDASSANYKDLGYALINYMDYDKGLTYEMRPYYTHNEWDDMMYSELENSRPVLLGGYGSVKSDTGHAFVLDGYEDGYYHINWGWGGVSDGYFKLSALAPMAQGTGGVDNNYNYNQEAIVGIQPNTHSSSAVVPNVVCDPMSVSYPSASEVTIGINIKYLGVADAELQFGIKIKSAKGDSTYMLTQPQTVALDEIVTSITKPLSNFALEDGTYTITAIVYDPATATYHEPRTQKASLNGGSCYLTAVISDGNVTFSSPEFPQKKLSSAFELPSTIYAGTKFLANVSVTAADDDFYGDVRIRFENEENNVESSNMLVDLAKGESNETKMILTAPSVAGQYNAYMVDTLGNALSDAIVVAVADSITSTLGFEATAIRMDNTTNVDPSNIKVELDAKCTGGSYCDNLFLFFFKSGEKGSRTFLVSDVIYMCEGDETTIVFSGSLPALEPATTYVCLPCYYATQDNVKALTRMTPGRITFTTAGKTAISSVAANGDPSEIKIYSLDGTLVDSQYGVAPNLESMPKGVYLVKQGGKTTKVVR